MWIPQMPAALQCIRRGHKRFLWSLRRGGERGVLAAEGGHGSKGGWHQGGHPWNNQISNKRVSTSYTSCYQANEKMKKMSKEWTNLALWLYASALPAARRKGGAPCCPCTASGEGIGGPTTLNLRGLNSPGSVLTRPGTSASAASGPADGSTPG